MAWDLTGNGGTSPAANFLGTTDNQPLAIRTNGAERLRIDANGNVGLGTSTPITALQIPERGLQIGVSRTASDNFHWTSDTVANARGFRLWNGNHGAGAHILTALPNGNVGIGTASPAARLHLEGGGLRWGNGSALTTDQGGSLELGGDGGTAGAGTPYIDFHYLGRVQDYNARLINDADGRLSVVAPTLRVTGSVGIGTADPANKLHLHGDSGNLALTFTNSANTAGKRGYRIAFDNDRLTFQRADDAGTFAANQVTIAQDTGNVGIGTLSPGARLEVAGDIRAADVFVSSDARLKADVAPLTGALARLRGIRGVEFTRRDPGDTGAGRKSVGVLAQEVEAAFPALVDARGDHHGYKAVNYSGLTGVLVEACKELHDENAVLRRRIEALEHTLAGV